MYIVWLSPFAGRRVFLHWVILILIFKLFIFEVLNCLKREFQVISVVSWLGRSYRLHSNRSCDRNWGVTKIRIKRIPIFCLITNCLSETERWVEIPNSLFVCVKKKIWISVSSSNEVIIVDDVTDFCRIFVCWSRFLIIAHRVFCALFTIFTSCRPSTHTHTLVHTHLHHLSRDYAIPSIFRIANYAHISAIKSIASAKDNTEHHKTYIQTI